MFVIELTYKVPLDKIDAYINEHVSFLDKYYASGNFIASGRKVPRSGGVILAAGDSKEQLQKIISEDPFYKNQLADYSITEFVVSKKTNQIESPLFK